MSRIEWSDTPVEEKEIRGSGGTVAKKGKEWYGERMEMQGTK